MIKRNVLLLGSGGREHALALKMAKSEHLNRLFIAPGNAGTAQVGIHLDVDTTDFEALLAAIKENQIDMVVVGPEAPLVAGVADFLEEHNISVIGPSKAGAQLEGSKAFAKAFMNRHNIPTAAAFEVTENNLEAGLAYLDKSAGPYVLKADGLAAGKGVLIINDVDEAKRALREMVEQERFGQASKKVVIEEFLTGTEFSVFALTDGKHYALLPEAKDYKRVGQGDTGLNTGGMGAISPVPFFDDALRDTVIRRIVEPTIKGLQQEKIRYKGFVYFGLIQTEQGPYVIEYNCRLGDPETQVVLSRLKNDLLSLFAAVENEALSAEHIEVHAEHAATVVVASGGYPETYEKGKDIKLPAASANQQIHLAGVAETDEGLITSGGRVLAVTSLASTLAEAVKNSNTTAEKVDFEGRFFRPDIGYEFI